MKQLFQFAPMNNRQYGSTQFTLHLLCKLINMHISRGNASCSALLCLVNLPPSNSSRGCYFAQCVLWCGYYLRAATIRGNTMGDIVCSCVRVLIKRCMARVHCIGICTCYSSSTEEQTCLPEQQKMDGMEHSPQIVTIKTTRITTSVTLPAILLLAQCPHLQ